MLQSYLEKEKDLKGTYGIISPDYNTMHSYVHKNGKKCVIDHAICKGINKDNSNVDCIWDFVTKENGYEQRTKDEYIGDKAGLPDHACCMFNLELL